MNIHLITHKWYFTMCWHLNWQTYITDLPDTYLSGFQG